MSEPYDFNVSIQTLKKELPETSQISIGDDACLFSIKYNGIDDKFSKPIRLVGNIMVFCHEAFWKSSSQTKFKNS